MFSSLEYVGCLVCIMGVRYDCFFFCFFFFFQAEDGIRDYKVTGVQTCALPISLVAAIPIFTLLLLLAVFRKPAWMASLVGLAAAAIVAAGVYGMPLGLLGDRKSTRLNSSHLVISYAVFCLKKKKKTTYARSTDS